MADLSRGTGSGGTSDRDPTGMTRGEGTTFGTRKPLFGGEVEGDEGTALGFATAGLFGSDPAGGLFNTLFGQADVGRVQFRPGSFTGPLSSTRVTQGGDIVSQASPALQQAMGGLFGAGGQLLGAGTEAATSDFSDLVSEELSTLRELAQPAEEQAAASTASRLFNQGVLGSTGGALQMQSLQEAQQQADLQRQLQALNRAQQQQQFGLQQVGAGQSLFGGAADLGAIPREGAQAALEPSRIMAEIAAGNERRALQARESQRGFLGDTIGSVASGLGSAFCSQSVKENKRSPYEFMEKIKQLPVEVWDYKEGIEDSSTHLGPYAEDFKEIFGLGDGTKIPFIDMMGVVLMGQKEMIDRLEALENG
jgi:hypothetical protein